MPKSEFEIGTIILDDGVLGVIINEIKSGTWSEEPLFNWTTSYEIRYSTGDHCVITEHSLKRLVEKGRIKILGQDDEQ